jgi:hypothetical protein
VCDPESGVWAPPESSRFNPEDGWQHCAALWPGDASAGIEALSEGLRSRPASRRRKAGESFRGHIGNAETQ